MDTPARCCVYCCLQGVLLPALGTFAVGQALEDRYATYKRYRPTFSLLEGRFGGVSQENSKFRLLSRAAVAQLNYQLISQDAQIHRSIAQRLLSEILQRLATHIVSGHAIKVLVTCLMLLSSGAAKPLLDATIQPPQPVQHEQDSNSTRTCVSSAAAFIGVTSRTAAGIRLSNGYSRECSSLLSALTPFCHAAITAELFHWCLARWCFPVWASWCATGLAALSLCLTVRWLKRWSWAWGR